MPRAYLNKKSAEELSIREVEIENDIWVKIRVPPPSKLMELEAMQDDLEKDGNSFELVKGLVTDYLIQPRIVEEVSENPDELTIDELGGTFLPIGMAIMDAIDVSGEARKKAETFLENQPGDDGGSGSEDVPHEAVVASSV